MEILRNQRYTYTESIESLLSRFDSPHKWSLCKRHDQSHKEEHFSLLETLTNGKGPLGTGEIGDIQRHKRLEENENYEPGILEVQMSKETKSVL